MSPSPAITLDDVRHVAKLSRLKLSEAELERCADQLAGVLTYIAKLNEVDIEGVEPLAHPLSLRNVLRDDEPAPGMPVADALLNAPEAEPPYFKVPKVLGDGSSA